MTILVTDASIFIDLVGCKACHPFFQLPYEVVTTYQIWSELEEEHHTVLNKWVKSDELVIIKIEEDFIARTVEMGLSRSLSIADRSIWFLCDSVDKGILLTSDGTLRKMAKRHGLKTHGLLWVFDECVNHDTISSSEAISKLEMIFNQNPFYRSDSKLLKAFEQMKKRYRG